MRSKRKKRVAGNSPYYHTFDHSARRTPRPRLERFDSHSLPIDRYDSHNKGVERFDNTYNPGGFWDDEDFDGDIIGLRNKNVYKHQKGRKQEVLVDSSKVIIQIVFHCMRYQVIK